MKSQTFYFGENALDEFQKELHCLSLKAIFLIRGKNAYKICGAKAVLERIFSEERIHVYEWFDFQENPKIEDLVKGVEFLRSSKASAIIACGGGSVLDMAKLVRFSNSYDGELTGSSFEKSRELLPLFALPTTAGTGCETTPFAVCYKDKAKYSVEHEDIRPDFAVVYPSFTYCNSTYLTACTGFDALAQAIEAYWNKNNTPESDQYALKAIDLIYHNLPKLLSSNNEKYRNLLSEGAYYAGKAIAITKTTAPHAFSYAFTTYCGYPHGHAVSLTFPFFLELNAIRFHQRLQCGIDETLYAHRMKILLDKLDIIPTTALEQATIYVKNIGLHVKGFNHYEIKYLLSKVNLQRLGNNPVKITDDIIDKLYAYLISNEKFEI